MAKQMILTDTETEKQYTLEFDKDTVKWAEGRGFDISDVARFPMTKLAELFWYAFRKNHKNVSKEKADRLLEGIGPLPDNFLERLLAMYSDPFSAYNGEDDGEQTPFVKVD